VDAAAEVQPEDIAAEAPAHPAVVEPEPAPPPRTVKIDGDDVSIDRIPDLLTVGCSEGCAGEGTVTIYRPVVVGGRRATVPVKELCRCVIRAYLFEKLAKNPPIIANPGTVAAVKGEGAGPAEVPAHIRKKVAGRQRELAKSEARKLEILQAQGRRVSPLAAAAMDAQARVEATAQDALNHKELEAHHRAEVERAEREVREAQDRLERERAELDQATAKVTEARAVAAGAAAARTQAQAAIDAERAKDTKTLAHVEAEIAKVRRRLDTVLAAWPGAAQ
jgi:hypothetical protein